MLVGSWLTQGQVLPPPVSIPLAGRRAMDLSPTDLPKPRPDPAPALAPSLRHHERASQVLTRTLLCRLFNMLSPALAP